MDQGFTVGATSGVSIGITSAVLTAVAICATVFAVSLARMLGVRARCASPVKARDVKGELPALGAVFVVCATAAVILAVLESIGDIGGAILGALAVVTALVAIFMVYLFAFAVNDVVWVIKNDTRSRQSASGPETGFYPPQPGPGTLPRR